MARQVLPIVGAVVGAYFGNPQLGYMIGTLVGNAVDPLVVKGPQIGDSRVQTSAEVWRPVYFGTACGAGNIIMAGPDIKRVFEESQGKGGGPITTSERIFKTFAIGIGDGWTGPILGISRIWENEKLVYDTRPSSTMGPESAKFAQQFRLYLGSEDQLPDEDLEAIPEQFGGGAGNVSAFRGLAYIVFPGKDITTWMSIPQYRFEVVTEGSATPAVDSIATLRVGVTNYWISSPDGIQWPDGFTADTEIAQRGNAITTSDESYVTTGDNVVPAYIDRGEVDWLLSTGSSTGGTASPARARGSYSEVDGLVVVPKRDGGKGLLRSADKGKTFADVSSGVDADSVCAVRFNWFVYHSTSVRYSSNSCVSFSDPVPVDIRSALGCCHATDQTEAMLCGSGDFPYEPLIGITSNGFHFEYPDLPDVGTGKAITACAIGTLPGDESPTYVAVVTTGEIMYRSPASVAWQLSSDTSGGVPKGVSFNGRRFILVAGDGLSGDTQLTIKSSENGISWTTRKTYAATGTTRFIDVASLALTAGTVTSQPINLSDSILRIHELAGQSLDKVDVTDLESKQLGGFILAGEYTGQAAIDMLGSIFMFVSPEYDKQIHHRFRGKPIVATITDDDLVDEPDEGLREDQIEFPKKLHLEAQNTASGYAPAKETSERESSDVRVVGELSVSAPVMFAGDAEAQAGDQARTASILHKVAWENARGEREIVLPDRFLFLVPGDCVLLNIRGRSDRMMIVQQNYVDGVLRLRLRYDRASAYVSRRAGTTPSEQTPPPSTIVGATGMLVLDIPALRDEDDINSAVRYVALGPLTPSWYGSQFGESLDGGSSYWFRMRRNAPGSVMGTLQVAVADASEHYPDRTNKVRLQLDLASYSERIQALTEQQFLSERGSFALVNASGDVEVCQYMEVDDLGNGLLELSVLLRGRVNSGTFAFPIGSRFVLLETVRPLPTQSSYIGQEIWHRAVSFDSTGETATIDQMDFEGNSQREWPVANLLLERAGDIVTATAVPRHRFGTDLVPVQSTNHRGYLWTATDGTNVITANTDNVTPSRAFNVTGWASPVTVTVAQNNRITGAGPTVSEAIA